MTGKRIPTDLFVTTFILTASIATAQNPKPPTPLPWSITEDDLPIPNAATLWVNGQNLTVYVDTTMSPGNKHKLSTLEIKWEGLGPGFVEENCDFNNIFNGDFDVCTNRRFAKVSPRGFGPVYDLGNVIPDGYLTSWSPADAWLVDGWFLATSLDGMDPNSPYFGPVSESSTLALVVLGMLGLVGTTRRH